MSTKKKILPFVTQYHPALPNLKNILMGKWHLIQNQPNLKDFFRSHPYYHIAKESLEKTAWSELNFKGIDFQIACERQESRRPVNAFSPPPQYVCYGKPLKKNGGTASH